MRLRSGKLPFLAAKMNFFTIRQLLRNCNVLRQASVFLVLLSHNGQTLPVTYHRLSVDIPRALSRLGHWPSYYGRLQKKDLSQSRHGISRRLCATTAPLTRSEEHTSELQSLRHLVCR